MSCQHQFFLYPCGGCGGGGLAPCPFCGGSGTRRLFGAGSDRNILCGNCFNGMINCISCDGSGFNGKSCKKCGLKII